MKQMIVRLSITITALWIPRKILSRSCSLASGKDRNNYASAPNNTHAQ